MRITQPSTVYCAPPHLSKCRAETIAHELPVQTGHDTPGSLNGDPAGAQQVQIFAFCQRVDREDVEELVVPDVVAVVDGDPLH